MNLEGRTALVTGASAGIGRSFALELAARRADLILTARRRDRLEGLAREIERQYGRKVAVIPADLALPEAPAKLFEDVAAQGWNVDLLVNNAGYGVPGFFGSQPWEKHADFLQVMVTSVVQLTHLCLPGMTGRGYGYVINVASLAGLLPSGPGHTLYGAAKAFLIKFSESLASEVRAKNVQVTAVCPGFTYSEFHDVLGNRGQVSKLPKWLWMNADAVARQGLDAAARGDVVYVNGGLNRAIASAFRIMPERIARRSIERRAKRIRVQG